MRLYLTRHGETEWNLLKKTQGRTETELTHTGVVQAERLAERLKKTNITAIYTSTLKRARDTANIIGEVLDCPIFAVEELQEMSLGAWEGKTFEEIKLLHPEEYVVWRNTPHLCKIPEGDTLEELTQRSTVFIRFLREKHRSEDNILLVSHALMSKVIITSCLGMEPGFIHRIRQDNTALNIINFHGEYPVVSLLNDTSHLGGYIDE